MSSGFVDWRLAHRIASAVAGGDGDIPRGFGRDAVESACEWATPRVLAYSRLQPRADLPDPEAIGRSEWCRAGLGSLDELTREIDSRLEVGVDLPGPAGPIVRAMIGAAAAAEAGLAVGYAARKVLGQYDIAFVDAEREPRLLFVSPNLAAAQAQLGGARSSFLRWIAAHETTHAVQFAAAPWLTAHLRQIIDEFLRSASAGLDMAAVAAALRRLIGSDPRRTVRAALRGELPRLLLAPDHAALMDRLQATMAMVEGHAEHVMDGALAEAEPGLARLRERLEARRAARSGLADVIARLLGLDLKLRQYRLGKSFCDAVVAEAGIDALNAAWLSPDALPDLAELESPAAWLARTAAPAAAAV